MTVPGHLPSLVVATDPRVPERELSRIGAWAGGPAGPRRAPPHCSWHSSQTPWCLEAQPSLVRAQGKQIHMFLAMVKARVGRPWGKKNRTGQQGGWHFSRWPAGGAGQQLRGMRWDGVWMGFSLHLRVTGFSVVHRGERLGARAWVGAQGGHAGHEWCPWPGRALTHLGRSLE